jgi:serine/threonine-protein kinase
LLPETEGASQPFFSPDGDWVGFLVPGAFKKVRVSGGAPSTICRVSHVVGMGATWGPDGTIVFSDGPQLYRVSAEGGTPDVLQRGAEPPSWKVTPSFLPDGDRVLFSIASILEQRLNVLSLRTGETRELPIGTGYAVSARYLPSGYLLYTESTRLMVVRVDFETLSARGTALTAVEGVFSPWIGNTAYSVSESGNLAYNVHQGGSQLVKVDRDGRTSPILELAREYSVPRVSPDGNRLAVAIFDPTVPRRDIWIYDLLRGSTSRLTFSNFDSTDPVWSVDGSRIAFASNRAGHVNVLLKASDAGGEEVEIGEARGSMMPEQWLPDDGGLLVKCYPRINWDICISRLGDQRGTEVVLGTEFNELMPSLSRDGRFVAYVSDESGRREVYVRRFRSGQGRWPVSTDGGDEPLFSPDGREIFYRNGDRMMAAAFASEPQVSISPPRVLFEGRFAIDPFNNDARNYDIMPDGHHFVMVRADEEAAEIRVVRNWMEEVKELMPDDK